MLKPILNFFGIVPDYDLDLMRSGQTLADVSVGVMSGIDKILKEVKVDSVVVQGDTTTSFIASLAAFYHKIPVSHVEAGLRSGDIYSPFPEEFNRKATGLLAHLHFAPTDVAAANLMGEKYSQRSIFVTGNTGIDALLEVKSKLQTDPALTEAFQQKYSFLNPEKKLILVTLHRRESFGAPLEEVLKGLIALRQKADVEILIPLHMNPEVRKSVELILGSQACWSDKGSHLSNQKDKIWLCEPLDYVPFVYLMNRSHFIITDSGGIQEEAPSLGKPVLIARERTERTEAIQAGTAKLVPLHSEKFLMTALELLNKPEIFNQMAQAKNPFGDGQASGRILDIMADRI
jgi:UDP-N-acetylglucosamine 2-epimerase (non-hydrolysing)